MHQWALIFCKLVRKHQSLQTCRICLFFTAWETVWCPSEKPQWAPKVWPCSVRPPRAGGQSSTSSPWPCIWHRSYPAVGRGGRASQSRGPDGGWRRKKQIKWKVVKWILNMKNYRKSYLWVQSGDIVAPFREIQELKTERFGVFFCFFISSLHCITVTSCHHYYFIMGVTEKNRLLICGFLFCRFLWLYAKVYCATMLQMYLAECSQG